MTAEKFPPGTIVIVTEDWYRNGAAGWFGADRVINKGLCGEAKRVTKGGLVEIELLIGRTVFLPPGNIKAATLDEISTLQG